MMNVHEFITASVWLNETPDLKEAIETADNFCREYAALTAPPAAETNDEGEYPLYLRAAKTATPPTCAVSEQIVAVVEAAEKWGQSKEADDATSELCLAATLSKLPPDWRSQIATVVAEVKHEHLTDTFVTHDNALHTIEEGEKVCIVRSGK